MEFNKNEKTRGFFCDLHIHSRFSRACSKNITIENLEKWARVKGLDVLGTGDFTHPEWLNELKKNLIGDGTGIYKTKSGFKFILTGEVSLMYTDAGEDGKKGRRVHLVLLAPNFETVDKINSWLDTKGRRDYDGRPIFKISCEDFTAKMKAIDDGIEVIPAHCMTPWFGVFGSDTGYDSLKEAFGSQIENIHAVESGMSADPEMLWTFSELNNRAIVSFSDSHSFWPWRLGREATIFSSIDRYGDIIKDIRENGIIGTIETDPCYGKYHFSGHRNCNFSCSPEECREINNICPVCGNKLTIGVADRVEKISNQNIEENKNRKNFYKLLPLHEIIALAKASTLASKKTWFVYNSLIERFGNEFNVLLYIDQQDLRKALPNDELLVKIILLNREGQLEVEPGYDGLYGEPLLREKQEKLF